MRWRSGSDAEDAQRLERLERVVERARVGDDLVPVAVRRAQPLEVRVASVDRREPVGLVDGDDAQPGEDRVALGLAAQQDRPRGLAGVLDELARRVDDAGDGAVEVAVVAAVELVFVAARRRAVRGAVSVGGCMSPVPGETGRRESPLARRAARPPAGLARSSGRRSPRPTPRRYAASASAATASAVGSGFGSRASSMRRAIVSIVCGVLADRVERAVFAPAGDVGDRLAADVEADGAEQRSR